MRIGAFAAFPENPQPRTGLGSPPVGVGQSLIHNYPTTVPPASIVQTQDAVFGPISVAPCHSVSMVVFPIPSGSSVTSDPKTILEDLGFTVTGIGRAPSGGYLVYATLTSGQQYTSNYADANVLVYSGENGTFQSGEAVTQGNFTAVISNLNDDSSTGSGSFTPTNWVGTLDPTINIVGSASGAYALPFHYDAVLVSPKGNGKLGVTNFSDLGAAGLTWSGSEQKCVKVVIKPVGPIVFCAVPGQSYNPSTQRCECPPGQQVANGRCQHVTLLPIKMSPCPPGSSRGYPDCLCSNLAQHMVNGQCQCPTGQSLVNGQCVQNISSTYTPPTQPQAPPAAPTGMSTGAMIAIGVVALGAIGGAAWWYTQKRKHAALPAAPAAPASPASELMFQNPFLAQECSACGPSQDYEAAPNPRRRHRRRRAR